MTADLKDKEDTVVITIGGPADDLLTHEIQQVSHIRLTEVDNVPGSTLQIQGLATIHPVEIGEKAWQNWVAKLKTAL